ncbi:hypothetical protein A0U91_14110 [Acetobacter persici]|uniref:Uncharacterized protein n=1 Tax=Acetobacter persici TaxID=1076596 RepID=A0A1U9LHM4_9PROT|nr:hypothetical protein A0U91_14110 [Acetobacter persici]
MAPDFRVHIWFAKFSSDKFLEILTRVIPSDQEYIVPQIMPRDFALVCQWMTDRECCYDAVAPQWHDPQGWSQIAARDDREINLSALEATQKPFACALGITEDDIGMCGAELAREGGKSSRQDAGLDADGDLPVLALARSPCAGVHTRHIVQNRLGPADELLTEDSRSGTRRGAGEQPDIQPLLQVV